MRNESEEYHFLAKLVDETRNMNKKKNKINILVIIFNQLVITCLVSEIY